MIIYKITNLINGKIYIGQTVQKLNDRWSDHSRPYRGKHFARSAISCAIQKYGKSNFIIEQIDSAETLEILNVMEQTYIKALNSLAPNGYNLELGGKNKTCHEETKGKISQTLKGTPIENRWTGGNRSKRTEEQKRHLSSLIKGRPNVVLHKKVQCIETNEIYESVNACAKAHNVNRVTIWSLIKSGKKGRIGLSFKFLE